MAPVEEAEAAAGEVKVVVLGDWRGVVGDAGEEPGELEDFDEEVEDLEELDEEELTEELVVVDITAVGGFVVVLLLVVVVMELVVVGGGVDVVVVVVVVGVGVLVGTLPKVNPGNRLIDSPAAAGNTI